MVTYVRKVPKPGLCVLNSPSLSHVLAGHQGPAASGPSGHPRPPVEILEIFTMEIILKQSDVLASHLKRK